MSTTEALNRRPAVSVILPAYASEDTLGGCLTALARQSWQDHEVIVVDSSADGASIAVALQHPGVRTLHAQERLLPHAARNRGAEIAHGDLLVFSDPDVYADPEWLARLIAAHETSGEVVVGALDCWGHRWFDLGVHLCKFAKWLPGQPSRWVDVSPTANMLVTRDDFNSSGRFPDDEFLGDVTFSRRLLAHGQRLRFQPDAIVAHHHVHTLRSFLHERFSRGRMYGALRAPWLGGRGTLLLYLLVSLFPIRLARISILVGMQAARSGWLLRYLATWPVVLAGHAASLLGESLAYLRLLAHPVAAIDDSTTPLTNPSSTSR